MSSNVGRCSPESGQIQVAASGRSSGVWPAASRHLLAVVITAAAAGLGFPGQKAGLPASEGSSQLPELRLDLNTAPKQVLLALPHVGPTLAEHLVQARDDRRFASVEDAGHRVKGLGASTLAKLAPHLKLPTAWPSDPGRSARASGRKAAGAKKQIAGRSRPGRRVPDSPPTLTSIASNAYSSREFEIIDHD
jgi:Helix-hairpin-helix motif